MGYYINPSDCSQQEGLEKCAKRVASAEWPKSKDDVLLCLVDNGFFTALAVCHSRAEMREFDRPADLRSRQWWCAPKGLVSQLPGLENVPFEE